MNKIIHIIAGLVISAGAFAQNNHMISLGVGYSNQSFYSFTNGEEANVDNTNWDIAFSVSGMGSVIRVNGGYGLELHIYPNGDINEALKHKDWEIMVLILKHDLDINQKNKDGMAPLHLASMSGENINFIKSMLVAGADKMATTQFGENTYELAIENELMNKNP
ncbi:MAG: hypothetical protein QNK70_03910 [Crocinitomicaceae bacterium]